jgi:hypothetical protein
MQANAIAGPSTSTQPGFVRGQDAPGVSELCPTQMELDLLHRIANGSGLSYYDTLAFLEMCNSCRNFFLSSFLGRHITSCTVNGVV